MKGNCKVSISQKQLNWIKGTAKEENRLVDADYVKFADCFYIIKPCTRLSSGGSYVGTCIIAGRYIIEKMYRIKFNDTGIIQIFNQAEKERLERENYDFTIIP